MRIARRLILLSIAALMLVPSPANASDQSVYDAYCSRDPQFTQLGKDFRRTITSFNRRATKRRGAAVLRVVKATRAELATVRGAVTGQAPSSANGTRAKSYTLKSLKWLDSSQATNARAVRAGVAGRFRDEAVLARRANKRLKASIDNNRLARRYYQRAGVPLRPLAG